MSTALAEPTVEMTSHNASPPILYSVTDETIEAMTSKYLDLTVKGIDDKKGLQRVTEARRTCKQARCAIEATRKNMKAESLEYGRKVDSEAKRLTSLIDPVEAYLTAQEKIVQDEIDRIESARLEGIRRTRLAMLTEAGGNDAVVPYIMQYSDVDFDQLVINTVEETRRRNEREQIQRDESERLRIQNDQLAVERAALDRQRREQEIESARLKRVEDDLVQDKLKAAMAEEASVAAAKKRVDDAKLDAERRENLEQAKANAAEQDRLETEQRLSREAVELKVREEAKESARQRAESLRPDREKLLSVADVVVLIAVPCVSSAEAESARSAVIAVLVRAAAQIREIVNGLDD